MPTTDEVNCNYAIVQQVQITAVEGDAVTFATRSNDKKLTSYTTLAANVMWHGPAQAPVAVAKKAGKVGNLYLDKKGWSGATKGGGIYGWDAANPESSTILFKWPRCLPFLPVEALELEPSSVVIVDGDGKEYDMFDTKKFAPAQRIVWNAAQKITVMTAAHAASDPIWPVKILVKGKPDGGIAGTVDILDNQFADFNQTLEWSKVGAAISPVLRPAGFGQFDAVMDSVHAVAEGRKVTYPGPTVRAWDDKTVAKLSAPNQKVIKAAHAALEKLTPEQRAQGSR